LLILFELFLLAIVAVPAGLVVAFDPAADLLLLCVLILVFIDLIFQLAAASSNCILAPRRWI
jgi:hypothetical protein